MSAIKTEKVNREHLPWTDAPAREDESQLPLAPREGWLTLIALIVMVGTVAVAVDDAVWAGLASGTHETQTKFLPVAALLSVLTGAWLAKRPWRTVVAQLIGATVGGLFLLYAIASTVSTAPSIVGRLHDLNISVTAFINEVFVQGARSTETSVFLLIMGALVWGVGQFAAFNVFRRHQAGPGIVVAGLMMLLNVSLTVHEEYVHLVVFVLAALLLVMRLNLFAQVREWRSRGMREVGDISSSFLRNGAVMIVVTIVASLVLATNASSAPLARAWNNVDDQLLELGYDVNHLLGGVTGEARGPNLLFTPTQTIGDFWQSSTETVFSATTSDSKGYRWRGSTYDSFDGRSWSQLDRQPTVVDADAPLLAASSEATTTGSDWTNISATVTPVDFGGDVFVAPANPVSVDQPAQLVTNGPNGPFAAAKLSYGLQEDVPYTVEATVPKTSGAGAVTANELGAAGTSYPDSIKRYLEIRPGSVGDTVAATAKAIFNSLPANKRDPYHVSEAVQDYLWGGGRFDYTTDVRGLCDGQQLVDCFLHVKKGYCMYFASAMVLLLRELNIPARFVVGYLPGQQQADGSWLVQRSASHAWVEVYFPNNGWVEFDPTPGNQANGQSPTHLAEGAAVVRASQAPGPSPAPSSDPQCIENVTRGCLPSAQTADVPIAPTGPDLTLPLVVGALALVAFVLLAVVVIRRVPSTEPEIAFNSLAGLASRIGHGRRPSQTAYEYADRLGELVPVASGDVRLIATAKVEATYGRRTGGEPGLIGSAYRRARIGLLRLMVRVPAGRVSRLARRKT